MPGCQCPYLAGWMDEEAERIPKNGAQQILNSRHVPHVPAVTGIRQSQEPPAVAQGFLEERREGWIAAHDAVQDHDVCLRNRSAGDDKISMLHAYAPELPPTLRLAAGGVDECLRCFHDRSVREATIHELKGERADTPADVEQ